MGSTVIDTIPTDASFITGSNAAGNTTASMVDACLDIETKQHTQAADPTLINALSARLAGLNTATCAVTPVSPTVENIFPYTLTTVTSNNFAPGTASTTPLNNGLIKGDWNISSHHHLDGMYFVSKATQINGSMEPIWDGDIVLNTQTYDAHWNWTPNSSFVNDFRFGLAYLHDSTLYGDANLLPSNPWPNGYGLPTGVTNPLFGGLPTIAITGGFTSLGNGSKAGSAGQTVRSISKIACRISAASMPSRPVLSMQTSFWTRTDFQMPRDRSPFRALRASCKVRRVTEAFWAAIPRPTSGSTGLRASFRTIGAPLDS